MLELFVVGGVLFWTLLFVEIVLMFYWVTHDHFLVPLISIIIVLALIKFFGNWNTSTIDVYRLALYSLGYLVIGVIWSVVKFSFYIMNIKKDWYLRNPISHYTSIDARMDEFNSYIKTNHNCSFDTIFNKVGIWVVYWPISFVESLFNDIAMRIARIVTNSFEGIYRKIYDIVISKGLK